MKCGTSCLEHLSSHSWVLLKHVYDILVASLPLGFEVGSFFPTRARLCCFMTTDYRFILESQEDPTNNSFLILYILCQCELSPRGQKSCMYPVICFYCSVLQKRVSLKAVNLFNVYQMHYIKLNSTSLPLNPFELWPKCLLDRLMDLITPRKKDCFACGESINSIDSCYLYVWWN